MFAINKSYDFVTLAPSILGASYTNMKVKGILTLDEAIKHSDVVTTHESVKSIISGLPVNTTDMVFVVFVDTEGAKLVLAESYIDPTSVIVTTTTNLEVRVFDIDSAMEPIIRLRLKELGVTNFTITNF